MKTSLLLLAVLVTPAHALDYRLLQGDYALGGKTLIDPPETEAKDSHVYFELSGDTARELYRALKGKAQPDVCGDHGDLRKRSGAVQCTRSASGKEYRCTFGIELGTQRVVNGEAC